MRLEANAIKSLDQFLEACEEKARPAAAMAMNDITGGKGLVTYRKAMRREVAFPAGYLEDVDRFGQTEFATPARLITAISGRQRPTSLARFVTSGVVGRPGVTIKVNPSGGVRRDKAWLTRLNSGSGISDGSFNLGLAVRVRPGEMIRGKKFPGKTPRLAPNVFLLYGPSVDQVFRTVAVTETPKVLDMMGLEFLRQFARL